MRPDETAGAPGARKILASAARAAAVSGLAALAGCATTPDDVRREAAPGNDDAADRVAPSLYSTDPAVRQAAIQELLKMKNSDEATGALLSATISPDPDVRGDAGAAMLFQPQVDLDLYSITLVADKDPGVRKKIAEGLAAAGRDGTYETKLEAGIYLWGLEQDKDPQVRAAAAQGLGELGLEDPMVFALAALQKDPDPRVRAAAATGLGTPARLYLAGESGPGWGDAPVDKFLAGQVGGRAPTPVQARGAEIVAALCQAARLDDGEYVDVIYVDGWFGRDKVEEKHWVAIAAAQALSVPGQAPRADVAAAQAAAYARVPAVAPVIAPAPEKANMPPMRDAEN
ncbi:MAG: HEAT repeat domain-containing protein [Opitutales bacterium]|jgi:HEAT repeat protein